MVTVRPFLSRRSLLWALLPVIALVTTMLHFRSFEDIYFSHDDASSDEPFHPPPADVEVVVTRPTSQWCQVGECSTGRWVPRTPEFQSLGELQAAYMNYMEDPWSHCPVYQDVNGHLIPDDEKPALEAQRLVDLLNWEWVPDRGRMLDLDFEDFVVRLLRSPGGMVMIGDSITRQHHVAITYMVRQANLTFAYNPDHLEYTNIEHVHQFVLHPSPTALALAEKAGVPASRLQRPFLTLIQNHLSLSEAELRAITQADPNQAWRHAQARVDDWDKIVKHLATPIPEEENTVTEDTVVLFNSGAHWSRGVLYIIPQSTMAEEHARLSDAYRKMARIHIERLRARLTTPYRDGAQAETLEAGASVRLMQTAKNNEDRKTFARWDWDQFAPHNDIFREEIARENARQSAPRGRPPRWHYLDVYDIALQRPDAHWEPGKDCLHWCTPVVVDEWTRQLLHQLALVEGRLPEDE
ncbi:hypothetical protein BD626DRAFT_506161 [Schizophyllum amplum]|uniref:Trichome birefringence-like C-terminal domain-containing protein n=1 Tax=Schizophyllum amplum TaxID=97359 RepID=A0A550C5D0_9AGAR|nr:hypothetical protein BD626DRAFT_506161 [Auriculariopsis ampla]